MNSDIREDERREAFEAGRKQGYSEGWAAFQQFRKDRHELNMVTGEPSGRLMTGIVLTVFGGLFVLGGTIHWWRFGLFDVWPFIIGLPTLTGAFFAIRGIPAAKRRAAEVRANWKWRNVK